MWHCKKEFIWIILVLAHGSNIAEIKKTILFLQL